MKIIAYVKRELRCSDFRYGLIFALATLLIGIASYLSGGNSNLYNKILLPKFAPPPIVFIIVWTVFFILLGFAAGLVYSNGCNSAKKYRITGLIFFFVDLFFIFIWYPIFFGMQSFLFALLIVALISVLTFLTMKYFVRVSIISGIIMLIFLAWSIFAFILNLSVVLLN